MQKLYPEPLCFIVKARIWAKDLNFEYEISEEAKYKSKRTAFRRNIADRAFLMRLSSRL